ncbi:MAG: NAD(P)/FAD-dependent oxidoreductase [Cyclobacteriaceae bacterium]
MLDVIIIGGGLSGLISSILLSRAGIRVTLLEAKSYPFHRVCGEYISNEVIPFLENHALYPTELEPSRINKLQITSVSGNSFESALDLGGFGISRYVYDQWLADQAKNSGVEILENTKASHVDYSEGRFSVKTNKGDFEARLVIAAHGKRSKVDKEMGRSFMDKRSPYVGVKYHLRTVFPSDLIALHNFENGYCGISQIEQEKFNTCYLVHRDQVRKYGSIAAMEESVLFKNPHLKSLFANSEFLFEKPEVINEITFVKKEPVHDHVLLCGDAAGMITPLCGNGMAMAIHSSKSLAEIIISYQSAKGFELAMIEEEYAKKWNSLFATRLWAGRQIQNLFGGRATSEIAVGIGRYVKPVRNFLIRQTHGDPFS